MNAVADAAFPTYGAVEKGELHCNLAVVNCIQYAFVLCILMPRIHVEISSQAGDFRCASQGDKSDQARAST